MSSGTIEKSIKRKMSNASAIHNPIAFEIEIRIRPFDSSTNIGLDCNGAKEEGRQERETAG